MFSYFGKEYRNDFVKYVRLIDCYCRSCRYIEDYYIWVSIGDTKRAYNPSELKLDVYDVFFSPKEISYETSVIIEFNANGSLNPLDVYNFIKGISDIHVKRNKFISFEEIRIKNEEENFEDKRTFINIHNKTYISYGIVSTACPYLCPEYKRPVNEFTKLNDITDEMFLNFIFDYHQKYGNIETTWTYCGKFNQRLLDNADFKFEKILLIDPSADHDSLWAMDNKDERFSTGLEGDDPREFYDLISDFIRTQKPDYQMELIDTAQMIYSHFVFGTNTIYFRNKEYIPVVRCSWRKRSRNEENAAKILQMAQIILDDDFSKPEAKRLKQILEKYIPFKNNIQKIL